MDPNGKMIVGVNLGGIAMDVDDLLVPVGVDLCRVELLHVIPNT